MFTVGETVCWSASDLTAASECEYTLLRNLDRLLGRGVALEIEADPVLEQIARLGDEHESRELSRLLTLHGEHDPDRGCGVAQIARASTLTVESLESLRAVTESTLKQGADVVYQAGFFDGEFHGYADFLAWSEDGWVVCDAKLARQARPKALLQLGAYADQLETAGFPVARTARLLLGNGRLQDFPLSDIVPVFRERRARLRHVIEGHRSEVDPVGWDDERYAACGRCDECQAAVESSRDLLLVAGMRMDQRKKLHDAGIVTIDDLAHSDAAPPTHMAAASFEKLQGQARLQVVQMDAGIDDAGRPRVSHEVCGTTYLRAMPAPSPGDIFFDFEGDPMYNEGDLERWGLEYLFGVMEVPVGEATSGRYLPFWAHSRVEERVAFVEFLDYVAGRRAVHPDLHIYHYAPYETAALKRLAAVHATHEKELDALLRAGVFVDLYGVVRGSIRISQPSYSIKKLEPLYMTAEEAREGDVQAGDASIVEYHEFRLLRESGKAAEADRKLAELAKYNEYDCLSTLRLRDWLLEQGRHQGVSPASFEPLDVQGEEDEEADDLFAALRNQAGSEPRADRTPEQQASAMLAFALGFNRRERLPFWWAHFDRLRSPVDEWSNSRDVFAVDDAVVEDDWAVVGQTLSRRTLRLRGRYGPGSTVKTGEKGRLLYAEPVPDGLDLPVDAVRGCTAGSVEIRSIDVDESGRDVVVVVEKVKRDCPTYSALPIALVPGAPFFTRSIDAAIRDVATSALGASPLPAQPAIDILCRRPPRLTSYSTLPQTGEMADDIVAALRDLDRSYLPVQGPPGTGKTFTGSHVIARLVQQHGWRIGVVAQSHAVVENMLDAIIERGLDPSLVGKAKANNPSPTWTALSDAGVRRFLADHTESGCVLGGTAWDFTSPGKVAPGTLDLLVVDEAGQFSLATTIGVSVASPRLLLLGDPRQLPQVSQGTHGEPVNTSALGWVMGDHEALPADLGYFLGMSYRMHTALCERVSRLSYAGDLHAHPSTGDRCLAGVAPGLEVITLNHRGNSVECEAEADEVVRQVRRLLGAPWTDPTKHHGTRPLAQGDFRVVAPYNAQVHMIHRRLAAAGLGDVRVGTVDKFQGQEAPVVIVSMTASSRENVPRGIGFLLNRNRINVAVSRAQWLAVLIRADALTAFMPRTPAGLLELGAFIGLCGDSDAQPGGVSR